MKRIIITGMILWMAMLGYVSVSFAYTVDGYVNDWGVDLSSSAASALGYLDAHTPSSGYYVTEDNDWQGNSNWVCVGPGFSRYNLWDAEALYFDYTATDMYIAIITGTPPSDYYQNHPSQGDIFIDTGKYQDPDSPDYNSSMYEYALNILDGKLYSVNSVIGPTQYSSSAPWILDSGTLITTSGLEFYSNSVGQNSHYVMEMKIPLSALGLSGDPAYNTWIHWTMHCGNDEVEFSPVPEPASLMLLGFGLMGLGLIRRRRI